MLSVSTQTAAQIDGYRTISDIFLHTLRHVTSDPVHTDISGGIVARV